MLFRLGHIALPKGIRQQVLASLGPYWRTHLRNRQLAQGDLERELADAVLARVTRTLGAELPVFILHVCIGGTATLKTSWSTLSIRRGDIFVLNPNCRHAVPSTTLCVSLCFTVPRAAVRNLVA